MYSHHYVAIVTLAGTIPQQAPISHVQLNYLNISGNNTWKLNDA